MEEKELAQYYLSDEELAQQKKQKSRSRIFGILLGLVILFSAIAIFEIVWLITK